MSCVFVCFVNVQFKRRVLEEVVVRSFKKGKRKKDGRLMIHPKKKKRQILKRDFNVVLRDIFDKYKGVRCI